MAAVSLQWQEHRDRWEIQAGARPITQCCVDFGFVVMSTDQDGTLEIRIEGPFVWQLGTGQPVKIDPEAETTEIGPALALFGRAIDRLTAMKDGALEILLTDGSSVAVPASETYEAWSIAGPRGSRIISTPGGTLAVWTPEVGDPGAA